MYQCDLELLINVTVVKHSESKSGLYFGLSLFLRFWSFLVRTHDGSVKFLRTAKFLVAIFPRIYAPIANNQKCHQFKIIFTKNRKRGKELFRDRNRK